MNILFLSEQFYPHGSGAELATYLYAKLLGQRGFKVRIVTNKYVNEPFFSQDEQMSTYRLPLFTPNDNLGTVRYQILSKVPVLFSSFIHKMIKWADIVYVPRFWYSTIPLAKAYRKRVITHFHDYIAICPLIMGFNSSTGKPCRGHGLICPPKCTYCCEKTTGTRALKGMIASISLNSLSGSLFSRLIAPSDAIICVAQAQKEVIAQSGLFPPQKLHVVINPCPDYSDPSPQGSDFGYFGGLDSVKGFSTLYSAAVSLEGSCLKSFNIHCTKMPNVTRKFSDLLQKRGFLTYGKLEKEKYDGIYNRISTVIVPSIWNEPWPYTVVQALLTGRYLIASRIGGIPDQVENCKGVILFQPGNEAELKTAMEKILNLSANDIIELGLKNREAYLRRFSNEESLGKFVSILESVC